MSDTYDLPKTMSGIKRVSLFCSDIMEHIRGEIKTNRQTNIISTERSIWQAICWPWKSIHGTLKKEADILTVRWCTYVALDCTYMTYETYTAFAQCRTLLIKYAAFSNSLWRHVTIDGYSGNILLLLFHSSGTHAPRSRNVGMFRFYLPSSCIDVTKHGRRIF